MVDYSKWDKLAADLSDDEEVGSGSRRVRVQRVEPGSKVVLSKGTTQIIREGADNDPKKGSGAPVASLRPAPTQNVLDYGRWDAIAAELDSEDEEEEERVYFEDEARKRAEADERERMEQAAAQDLSKGTSIMNSSSSSNNNNSNSTSGGKKRPRNLSYLGYDAGSFLWTQDRDTIEVRVRVPAGTRAKDVKVQQSGGRLRVALEGESHPRLDRKLAFAVFGDGGSSGGAPVSVLISQDREERGEAEGEHGVSDWQLEDLDAEKGGGEGTTSLPPRAVVVTMCKRTPSVGVVQWWTKAFEGDEQTVDMDELGATRTEAASRMQQVWDDAHRMFREKIKAQKPVEVQVNDEEDGEEEEDE